MAHATKTNRRRNAKVGYKWAMTDRPFHHGKRGKYLKRCHSKQTISMSTTRGWLRRQSKWLQWWLESSPLLPQLHMLNVCPQMSLEVNDLQEGSNGSRNFSVPQVIWFQNSCRCGRNSLIHRQHWLIKWLFYCLDEWQRRALLML